MLIKDKSFFAIQTVGASNIAGFTIIDVRNILAILAYVCTCVQLESSLASLTLRLSCSIIFTLGASEPALLTSFIRLFQEKARVALVALLVAVTLVRALVTTWTTLVALLVL